MSISRTFAARLMALLVIVGLAGCGASSAPTTAPDAPATGAKTYSDMVLCYPQLGAESDWRTANTASIKETAATLGIKQLVFSDAQQKQENQISAVRACIQQGVDVIALPPVVEDGWDAVLTEAKNAGIPVIIVDRSVSADKSLYSTHIGSNMVLEGERAAAEFNKMMPNGGAILELSGTTGSGAAVGRAKGLRNKLNSNITITDWQLHPCRGRPCDAGTSEEIYPGHGFPRHLYSQRRHGHRRDRSSQGCWDQTRRSQDCVG